MGPTAYQPTALSAGLVEEGRAAGPPRLGDPLPKPVPSNASPNCARQRRKARLLRQPNDGSPAAMAPAAVPSGRAPPAGSGLVGSR